MKFTIEVLTSHAGWHIYGRGNPKDYISSYVLNVNQQDYNKLKIGYLKTNLNNFFIRFEKYRQQKEG
jgi:hypothetical protein